MFYKALGNLTVSVRIRLALLRHEGGQLWTDTFEARQRSILISLSGGENAISCNPSVPASPPHRSFLPSTFSTIRHCSLLPLGPPLQLAGAPFVSRCCRQPIRRGRQTTANSFVAAPSALSPDRPSVHPSIHPLSFNLSVKPWN